MFAKYARWIAPLFALVLTLASLPGTLHAAQRPGPQPLLSTVSVSVSGPTAIALHQSPLYTANAGGGAAPYTYSWQMRFYSPSSGWGSWSSPYSTGTSNTTYASINSCGLSAFELRATATDAYGSTGSGSIVVYITNPC